MPIEVLALDLERTLIDNSLSGRPRPGLHDFLLFCHERFQRVAVFTTVEETDARAVTEGLANRGYVPTGMLASLEYIDWSGEYKNLCFVPKARSDDVLLVDDDAGWIRPEQRDRWITIAEWDGGADTELTRVRRVLEARISVVASHTADLPPL